MRLHHARAVGQTAFAVVAWLSCLPAASACVISTSGDTAGCALSEQAMIAIVVVIIVFLLTCIIGLRRRRLRQNRVVRLSIAPNDGARRRLSNIPKPYSAPVPSGYSAFYQTTPPAPLPAHTPQYPPRGYDTYHGYSRPQMSTFFTAPESTAPASPALVRAPSSAISRPISSLANTTSPSFRSSVHRDEPSTNAPPPPSSPPPVSPHGTQRRVAEPPLPLLRSSPPRNPNVAIPPASVPSPRPPGAISPLNAPRPSVLTPMQTGALNIDEPPPAYTPV